MNTIEKIQETSALKYAGDPYGKINQLIDRTDEQIIKLGSLETDYTNLDNDLEIVQLDLNTSVKPQLSNVSMRLTALEGLFATDDAEDDSVIASLLTRIITLEEDTTDNDNIVILDSRIETLENSTGLSDLTLRVVALEDDDSVSKLTTRVTKNESDILSLSNRATSLETDLPLVTARVQTLENDTRVEELVVLFANHENRIDVLELQNSTTVIPKLNSLDSRLTTLEEAFQLDDTEDDQTIVGLIARITTLETDTRIATLTTRLTTLEIKHTNDNLELENAIDILTDSFDDCVLKIDQHIALRHEERLRTIEVTNIPELHAKIDTEISRINDLISSRDNHEIRITHIENTFSSKAEVDTLKVRLANLESVFQIDDQEDTDTFLALSNRVSILENDTRLANLIVTVEENTTNIESNATQISSLWTVVNVTETRSLTNKTSIEGLSVSLSGLKTDYDNWKPDIETRIAVLENDTTLANLVTTVNSFNTRITTAETLVTELDNRVDIIELELSTTIKPDIASLKLLPDRIEENEVDIAALESDFITLGEQTQELFALYHDQVYIALPSQLSDLTARVVILEGYHHEEPSDPWKIDDKVKMPYKIVSNGRKTSNTKVSLDKMFDKDFNGVPSKVFLKVELDYKHEGWSDVVLSSDGMTDDEHIQEYGWKHDKEAVSVNLELEGRYFYYRLPSSWWGDIDVYVIKFE